MTKIDSWNTEEIELMCLGFCSGALESKDAKQAWLFQLVNAVNEDWFTCDNRKTIYRAMREILLESGTSAFIPKNALAIKAEKLGSEQSDWARGLIARAKESVVIYDPAVYLHKILPMWRMKLMRSEMKEVAAKILESFDQQPSERLIDETIPALLEQQQNLWSDGLSFSVKNNGDWAETIDELLSPLPEDTSIRTGIKVLDENIGGGIATPNSAYTSRLIVIAARPAMGKTSFAVTLATQIARIGYGVAFFSLEMPRKQIEYKAISCLDFLNLKDEGPIVNPVTMNNLKNRSYTESQRERLESIKNSRITKNLEIIDAGQSASSICNAIRAFVKIHPSTRLIVIDYLQLIKGCSGDGNKSAAEAVGEVTSSLKSVAKEVKTDIVLLSQVNRGVESRIDKIPTLADLRASGRIEEDADCVMFLYRPAYYSQDEDPGELAISIAKNRHGISGILKCRCHLENSVIFDL
jgi:replicative DNA helicase